MPIVQSFGALQAFTNPPPVWAAPSGSLSLYGRNQAYADIYATQPNVRICVDFLSRNIAEPGLHVFRRVSDTDRVRLVDHDLARWMGKPNPANRRYRLIENLMGDLGIYFNAYWLKVRYVSVTGRPAIGLVRIPPEQMEVEGGLLPTAFQWTANGRRREFPLSEIVHFNGYNPSNPLMGLSPLETLRQILAEEAAAGDHREAYWRNSARIDGIVTRPKEKPRYTEGQAAKWRELWQATYAGGMQAGKTVLLQDGETFTPASWSAKDSEYTTGGKLRREICAASYHIPQPMVGILEHATFSNVKEQHKHLYQDTLGPWFEMIVQEIEGQLLIECDDQTDVYSEFNIAAKLAGTPDEQIDTLVRATGRPIMKVNEARAKVNLPKDDDPDSDRIAAQQGGPASTPAADVPRELHRGVVPDEADDDEALASPAVAAVVQVTRVRQQRGLAKYPADERAPTFNLQRLRWNRELAQDLTPYLGADRAARLAAIVNMRLLLQLDTEAFDA